MRRIREESQAVRGKKQAKPLGEPKRPPQAKQDGKMDPYTPPKGDLKSDSQAAPAEGEKPEGGAFRRPWLRRLYDWVLHWADTPYGTPALFVISFAESSFFPIPPDVLQIALSVAKPKRSFFYAGVSAVASVLGAVLGWAIGFWLWAVVGDYFLTIVPGFKQEHVDKVTELYQGNAFLAVFTAAFSIIPFKVFTLTAGACKVPLATLVGASILGRSGRFFLVAGCIYLFGPQIKVYLERYFDWIALALTALMIAGVFCIKYLLH